MSCASSYLSKIVVVEGDPYTEGLKSFKVKKCDSEYKNKRDPTQSVLASDGH